MKNRKKNLPPIQYTTFGPKKQEADALFAIFAKRVHKLTDFLFVPHLTIKRSAGIIVVIIKDEPKT